MSSGNSGNTVKIPAMLPTAPLPLNAVVATSNVMYMYSCSQCEFKTHIESLFKQHVDSVHLGLPTVPANVILGQNTSTQVQIQAPTATTVSMTVTLTKCQNVHLNPENDLSPDDLFFKMLEKKSLLYSTLDWHCNWICYEIIDTWCRIHSGIELNICVNSISSGYGFLINQANFSIERFIRM